MNATVTCSVCGAALGVRQEYCLECGARAAVPRRPLHWLWPAAVAALVAAGGAYGAIELGGSSDANSTIVALGPLKPGSRPVQKPASAKRTSTQLRHWPERNGHTVVLAAIPVAAGPAAAMARARQALAAGLPDVGILESATYASLHPGYSIVFSGIYRSRDEALIALPRAARRFRTAYAQEITR